MLHSTYQQDDKYDEGAKQISCDNPPDMSPNYDQKPLVDGLYVAVGVNDGVRFEREPKVEGIYEGGKCRKEKEASGKGSKVLPDMRVGIEPQVIVQVFHGGCVYNYRV